MSNIETTQEKKPDSIIKEYITSSQDIIQVQYFLCHRCNQYIINERVGHPACQRRAIEEESYMREEQRKVTCLQKYGQVLTSFEERRRDYPDQSVNGEEPYNKMLARIEAERRQSYYDRRAARTDRKEKRLPDAQRQLKWLTAQVKIDEREQVEDDANEEKRLKEQRQ